MGLLKYREFRHLEPRMVLNRIQKWDLFIPFSAKYNKYSYFINRVIKEFGFCCPICEKERNFKHYGHRLRTGVDAKIPNYYVFTGYTFDKRVHWWKCYSSLCIGCMFSFRNYLRRNDYSSKTEDPFTKLGYDKLLNLANGFLAFKASRLKE